MAENKWEMARQDYLLAKQLQGLSQRTMDDYDHYTGRFMDYLDDNTLEFATSSYVLTLLPSTSHKPHILS